MPRIFKIGKLDIRHNTPCSRDDLSWLEVTNFYWGDRFLGAKVPTGYTVIVPHGFVSIITKPSEKDRRRRFKGYYFHAHVMPKKHSTKWGNRFFPLRRIFRAWRWYRAWQAEINKETL